MILNFILYRKIKKQSTFTLLGLGTIGEICVKTPLEIVMLCTPVNYLGMRITL